MIESLKIENFKAWNCLNNIKLSPITGFFGTNSSGKSSIIQSLLLLKQTLESTDRTLPLHLGAERDYVELGMFKDIVTNHKVNEKLLFQLGWK